MPQCWEKAWSVNDAQSRELNDAMEVAQSLLPKERKAEIEAKQLNFSVGDTLREANREVLRFEKFKREQEQKLALCCSKNVRLCKKSQRNEDSHTIRLALYLTYKGELSICTEGIVISTNSA